MPSLADNLPYTQMPWDQTTWLSGLANEAQNAPRFKPVSPGPIPSYSGGLGSGVANAAGTAGAPGTGTTAGGVLGGLNQVNQLVNRFAPGSIPQGVETALGDANSIYGMYNAFAHPSAATALGGVAGGAHLYNQFAPALGGTKIPAGFTTGLAGVGDVAGIYNAFKNPTPGNVASGLYDARNLYGIGSNIAQNMGLNSAITSAAAPGLADAAAGAGIGDLSAAPGLSSAMSGAASAGADMSAGALGGAGAGAGTAGALGALSGYSSSPEVLAAMNAVIPDAAVATAGGAAEAGSAGAAGAAGAASPIWAAAGPAAAATAVLAILGNYNDRKQDQALLNKGAGPGTGWMGNYKGLDLYSNPPINPAQRQIWNEYMAMHANDPAYGPGKGSDAGTGH